MEKTVCRKAGRSALFVRLVIADEDHGRRGGIIGFSRNLNVDRSSGDIDQLPCGMTHDINMTDVQSGLKIQIFNTWAHFYLC